MKWKKLNASPALVVGKVVVEHTAEGTAVELQAAHSSLEMVHSGNLDFLNWK